MMDGGISGHSIVVVVVKDQISTDVGGEEVILDIKSGVYYGLGAIGARIWNLIQEPRTVNDIKAVILKEYEVAAHRCEQDLLALLEELRDKGLIEVKDGAAV